MKHLTGFAAGVLFALFIAGTAQAQPIPEGGVTRQEVASWFRTQGMQAKVGQRYQDEVVEVHGLGDVFWVYFLNCKGERCQSVQFAWGWGPAKGLDMAAINRANAEFRYLRTYRNDSGEVWSELDADVAPGGSWTLFNEAWLSFKLAIGLYRERGFDGGVST